MVGTVCITSSESFCSLFNIVVFPALSSPRIRILHSLEPNMVERDWTILERSKPLCLVVCVLPINVRVRAVEDPTHPTPRPAREAEAPGCLAYFISDLPYVHKHTSRTKSKAE